MDNVYLFHELSEFVSTMFPEAEARITSVEDTLEVGQAVAIRSGDNLGIYYRTCSDYPVGAFSTVIKKCIDKGMSPGNFFVVPSVSLKESTINALSIVMDAQGIKVQLA